METASETNAPKTRRSKAKRQLRKWERMAARGTGCGQHEGPHGEHTQEAAIYRTKAL